MKRILFAIFATLILFGGISTNAQDATVAPETVIISDTNSDIDDVRSDEQNYSIIRTEDPEIEPSKAAESYSQKKAAMMEKFYSAVDNVAEKDQEMKEEIDQREEQRSTRRILIPILLIVLAIVRYLINKNKKLKKELEKERRKAKKTVVSTEPEIVDAELIDTDADADVIYLSGADTEVICLPEKTIHLLPEGK